MELLKLDLDLSRPDLPDAPEHLSDEARDLWGKYVVDHNLYDTNQLTHLNTAMEAFDRMRQAQKVVTNDGILVEDSKGKPLPHPAIKIEERARMAMITALAKLNINVIPVRQGPGRPSRHEQMLDGFE